MLFSGEFLCNKPTYISLCRNEAFEEPWKKEKFGRFELSKKIRGPETDKKKHLLRNFILQFLGDFLCN